MPAFDLLLSVPTDPLIEVALGQRFALQRLHEAADEDRFLAAVGPNIKVLVTGGLGRRQIGAALLGRLPALELIAHFGVGYDAIDAKWAAAHGIVVTHTPDVLNDEVADLAMGLLLATVRQIPRADFYLRAGHWEEKPFPLTASLRGRRLGILGLGRIGLAIAARAASFGIEIAYYNRRPREDVAFAYHADVIGLARASDILLVAAPATPETRHIVNAAVLEALGPEGILINIARGSLVDEQALIPALQNRVILGAGLDVFETEPHVPATLIALENTVLLPHVGSASHATRT
ncbi:MAG: 2-hydroxyacid dehydrogenase, partial [Beijerinckiaceae bacterium]|nr:2-hydroxyacid dehydrogenase [Beijerinckiaceae bacterium]